MLFTEIESLDCVANSLLKTIARLEHVGLNYGDGAVLNGQNSVPTDTAWMREYAYLTSNIQISHRVSIRKFRHSIRRLKVAEV